MSSLLGLAVTVGLATAGVHETGLGLGMAWHDGPRQVLFGAGPRVVHRYTTTAQSPWFVQGGLERIWFVVPAWGLSTAAGLRRAPGRWSPEVSVELALYSARLIKTPPEFPTPPMFPPTSLRLRIAPLVFQVTERTRISALELGPGLGLDTPAQTRAFGVSVFSVAHRW